MRRSAGRLRWSATRPRDRRVITGPAPSGYSAGQAWRCPLPGEQLLHHLAELLELERLGHDGRLRLGEKRPVAWSLVFAGDEDEEGCRARLESPDLLIE